MVLQQDELVKELAQGKELAKQLLKNFNPSISSKETQRQLLEKIISSYGKAFSMLGVNDSLLVEAKPTITATLASPLSSASDSQFHKDSVKKRKTFPRRTEKVKVSSGANLEGCLEDGYNWRKYGQKHILGASFPRGYYRCTHRFSQGCLATKLVQRSDKDPTIYEVTYKGRHTCMQASISSSSSPKLDNINDQNKDFQEQYHHQENPTRSGCESSWVKVETPEIMETFKEEQVLPPFSFPSPSNYIGSSENLEMSCSSFMEQLMGSTDVNFFMGGVSPSFVVSPTTSDQSNYFSPSLSPSSYSHVDGFEFGFGSESDLTGTETVSGPASVANSPIGDFSFGSLEGFEFDNDNSDLFSIFYSSTPTTQ